jgi:AcrR family transcriptional regulator
MGSDSRANMVRSAASLIGSRGVSGTSLSDVLADSGAPRGSIYHHFPGGKRQLAEDAVRTTAERVLAAQRACPATTAAGVLECFIGMWRRVVIASHATSGCVIAGVAVDTGPDEQDLMAIVRVAFGSWVALLTEQLEGVGVASDRARPIAMATLAGMEGALILCRAEGGVGPLDAVAAELMRLLPA